jgi:hypothetical protein
MAIDTGIVTIYDMKNGGAPLTAHRIDAKEFLAHPSGRWATSPDGGKETSKGKETGEDTGEAMRLKSMSFKALQAMADKAGISKYASMSKADLVAALEEK